MKIETQDYGHWVLDNDLEDAGFERKQELVIESIESQIFNWNLVVDEEGKHTNDSVTQNFEDKNIVIENPFKYNERNTISYSKKTQHWIGVVEKIEKNNFVAKLYDKSNETTYEMAEFEFNEVSKSDLKLLKQGGVFYFSIGFTSNNGQIKKESFLRFQRNIAFTNDDLDHVENRVERLSNRINWE